MKITLSMYILLLYSTSTVEEAAFKYFIEEIYPIEDSLHKLNIYGKEEEKLLTTSIWNTLTCFEGFEYVVLNQDSLGKKYKNYELTTKEEYKTVDLKKPIRKNKYHPSIFFSKKEHKYFFNIKKHIKVDDFYYVQLIVFNSDKSYNYVIKVSKEKEVVDWCKQFSYF